MTTSQDGGSLPRHHVIVGNGVAGKQAAETLRNRDPESRITIITFSRMLPFNRYLLPKVFLGRCDWRDFLTSLPEHYIQRRISVRRDCMVTGIDSARRFVHMAHNESIHYDTLLVATGGRAVLPEELVEFRSLLHGFGSFEQAMKARQDLSEGGIVVMLGGDMIGLDLARTLIKTGWRVRLVTGEATFWPHQVSLGDQAKFCEALAHMGIEVTRSESVGGIVSIEPSAPGLPARRIVFRDGSDLFGDVVIPFLGLHPAVDFMLGAGVDMDRGLLVSPELRTTNSNIFAAGDVCQIWSSEEQRYRFYYGYRNVRAMGMVAAINMTGGHENFFTSQDESLRIDGKGHVESPFWEYEM